MKSIVDYTILNSVEQDALTPKPKKPLPFPLENMDEEIGNAYKQMDLIVQKIVAAKQNPINNTPARKRSLKALEYKCKTCLKFIQDLSSSIDDFSY